MTILEINHHLIRTIFLSVNVVKKLKVIYNGNLSGGSSHFGVYGKVSLADG